MNDDGPSRRQLAKAKRRKAGDRSADLARTFMQMKDTTLAKLELEEELREAIDRARSITALVARRRAERTLAGELRRFELGEVETQLANIESTGVADSQLFHLAEQWRTKLIEEDNAAFPDGGEQMPRLVADARREHATGRPPGAKRALFRHVLAKLRDNKP